MEKINNSEKEISSRYLAHRQLGIGKADFIKIFSIHLRFKNHFTFSLNVFYFQLFEYLNSNK
jgi:hypothetical protein